MYFDNLTTINTNSSWSNQYIQSDYLLLLWMEELWKPWFLPPTILSFIDFDDESFSSFEIFKLVLKLVIGTACIGFHKTRESIVLNKSSGLTFFVVQLKFQKLPLSFPY